MNVDEMRRQARIAVDPLLLRFRQELFGSGVSFGRVQPSALPTTIIYTTNLDQSAQSAGFIKGVTTLSGVNVVGTQQRELSFINAQVTSAGDRTTITIPDLGLTTLSGSNVIGTQQTELSFINAQVTSTGDRTTVTIPNLGLTTLSGSSVIGTQQTELSFVGFNISSAGQRTTVTFPQHTHPLSDLTQSNAATNNVIRWNGSQWVASDYIQNVRVFAANPISVAASSYTLPADHDNRFWIENPGSSTVTARFIIGDGTGKQLNIARRTGNTTTDFIFIDDRGAFGVNSAPGSNALYVQKGSNAGGFVIDGVNGGFTIFYGSAGHTRIRADGADKSVFLADDPSYFQYVLIGNQTNVGTNTMFRVSDGRGVGPNVGNLIDVMYVGSFVGGVMQGFVVRLYRMAANNVVTILQQVYNNSLVNPYIAYDRVNNRVGINTAFPGYTFHIAGVCAADSFVTLSSITRKNNIDGLSLSALDRVKQMRAVKWKSKNEEDDAEYSGFIAEELKEVYPEAVRGETAETLAIDLMAVIALLTKAIQELDDKIEERRK